MTTASPIVVIDIDNTIIDTAVRKRDFLKSHDGKEVALKVVREDFDLSSVFAAKDTKLAADFFRDLDTPEAIQSHPAPAIAGAAESVQKLRDRDYALHFLTARPAATKAATIEELAKCGITVEAGDISCVEGLPILSHEADAIRQFKVQALRELTVTGRVTAVIGDRPEDLQAAHALGVPAVLLLTTVTRGEARKLLSHTTVGAIACDSWSEVVPAIERFRLGAELMQKLRDTFTGQYASWLRDIDEKAKTVVAISSALVAFAGTQLKGSTSFDLSTCLLLGVVVLSTLAIWFGIRAFTSRSLSGSRSSQPIGTTIKQFIGILFEWAKPWRSVPGDPLDEYERLRSAAPEQQATQHLAFFYQTYQTYDPNALLNLRLLELRANNYIKAYAERIASKCLMWVIVLIVAWAVSDRVLPFLFSLIPNATPGPHR